MWIPSPMALRERCRADGRVAQRAKCSVKWTRWRVNLAICILALTAGISTLPACVDSSECDQSSPCESDAEVCFDYICRPICESNEQCGEQMVCTSCELENSCYGRTESACVEDDESDDY